jgi:hypothetical protein
MAIPDEHVPRGRSIRGVHLEVRLLGDPSMDLDGAPRELAGNKTWALLGPTREPAREHVRIVS